MKNFVKRLSAVLTAAVITVSAAGTVSAQEEQQEENAPKYTGWVTSGDGWKYLENGEPCNFDPHKIDGVMCDFSLYGYYIGSYSGWENDRCYENGFPYTGWTDNRRLNEMREEYYCIDGYKVTGDFPVGDKIYSFGKTGKYTGKSRDAGVIISCGEKISADADKIKFTIENLNDEGHKLKVAKGFEYFKDGKWVSCKNKVLYSPIDKELSKKGERLSFETDVSEYSRNKFNEGFYRLPIICGEETYYAVFEAVAPIELMSQKDEYVFANNVKTSGRTIHLDMTINSDKKDMRAENVANSISVKLEKQTANGWTEIIEDIPWEIGYTDDENRLEIAPEFIPEEGYYRVTATVGKKIYTDTFRVRNHMAEAWLDEYDLNNKDLTISFTVINCGDEPIKICTFPYGLYQKNPDGTWRNSDVEGAAVEISSDAYTTLNGGKSTAVNFDISNYYNMSELAAGEYAVDIGGIGLAEFTLTDKPAEKNLPFKDLKAENVKEIIIEDNTVYFLQKAVISSGNSKTKVTDVTEKDDLKDDWRKLTASARNSEYLNRSITYLRQFEIKDRYKNYDDIYVGGSSSITVVYKDGTKTELFFYTSDAVRLDGTWYHCGRYVKPACMAVVKELIARNLPFEDIEESDLKEIRIENSIDNTVYSEVLMPGDIGFHNAVIGLNWLELKDVCENYEIPAGNALTVKLFYTDETEKTLFFYTSDTVVMPDGKAYYCLDNFYRGISYMFFDKYYGELEEDTT